MYGTLWGIFLFTKLNYKLLYYITNTIGELKLINIMDPAIVI